MPLSMASESGVGSISTRRVTRLWRVVFISGSGGVNDDLSGVA